MHPAGVQVIVSTLYMAFAACLAEYLCGCLVLPTLARHELQTTTALVIRVKWATPAWHHTAEYLHRDCMPPYSLLCQHTAKAWEEERWLRVHVAHMRPSGLH